MWKKIKEWKRTREKKKHQQLLNIFNDIMRTKYEGSDTAYSIDTCIKAFEAREKEDNKTLLSRIIESVREEIGQVIKRNWRTKDRLWWGF